MKRKIFLFCTLLLFPIFSSHAISQEKTKFGINAGIGEWRRMSLDVHGYILHHEYPIGCSVGFVIENSLSDHFSVVNELQFQSNTTTVIIVPGVGEVNEKVVMKKLVVPVLMKYQASWLVDSYFLLGPSVGYLIDAQYEYFIDPDGPPYIKRSAEITKDLPAIETALEFGVGKGVKISGGELQLEVRGEWGFTRFDYQHYPNDFIPDIGSWKNGGLQFDLSPKIRTES